MPKLCVLILTMNEENHIAECIASAKFSDEIVVVDSGSTDKTAKIARKLGAKVVYRAMPDGFAAQRNFALTQTAAGWVMYLDADERVTPELAGEIKKIVGNNEPCACEILRVNHVLGQQMRYGVCRPDWSLRLYPRTAVNWSGIIHESAYVTCPKRKIEGKLLHYPYDTLEQYFRKFNSYTEMMAQKMQEEGKQISFAAILFRPFWAFIRVYFLQSGWRDGKLGFVLSVLHAFYTYVKYVRLYHSAKSIPAPPGSYPPPLHNISTPK